MQTGDKDSLAAGRDHTNTFIPNTGKLKLTALVDESSIEVFVNDGEKTITQVFYYRPDNIGGPTIKTDQLGFYVEGGADKKATVQHMVITPYRSMFGSIQNQTADIAIAQGSNFNPLTYLQFTNTSGDGTTTIPSVMVKDNQVNTAVTGVYPITVAVTNSSGKYQEFTIPVKVVNK